MKEGRRRWQAYKGWKSESLAELKRRFPDAASLSAFQEEKGRSFLHALCKSYNPRLDLAPVLEWLCGAPHFVDMNQTPTSLMLVTARGALAHIQAVLDRGADMNVAVEKMIFENRVRAACTVLDVAVNETHPRHRKRVLLFLLDRGARRITHFTLPDYATLFVQQREPTRIATIAFLSCCKKSPLLRPLDRYLRTLLGGIMWQMRFNV